MKRLERREVVANTSDGHLSGKAYVAKYPAPSLSK
jgi:hypothetical protein